MRTTNVVRVTSRVHPYDPRVPRPTPATDQPAPLDIATPGIIEFLLDDDVMGAWEMTRRFGRPVSEADLAAALNKPAHWVTKTMRALEDRGLVARQRSTSRLPRGGWRVTNDRILLAFDRTSPQHRALADRMIAEWTRRSRRLLDAPAQALSGELWEKRAFTLEHLDEHELQELRTICASLDTFMARVGAKHDGRPRGTPAMSNYFVALHVIPVSEPLPPPARIQMVPHDRVGSKAAQGLDMGVKELSPRERDVVRLLSAGKTRARIAADLGITEATVRTLASRCYRKLGISGRRELATRVLGLPNA
jgi:DNA-binding CsgD family transcriptional regulator